MLVCVPLHASQLNADAAAASGGLAAHVESLWQAAYAQQNSVRVLSPGAAADDGAYLNPQGYAAKDTVELMVAASADSAQMMLIARLDNLGKGAGGAAVQNLNLMFGLDEHEGLDTA